jgi:hypothetical protein
LEFDVPAGCKKFVLEVGGQKFEQMVPAEHHDDDDDDDHEPVAAAADPGSGKHHH